MHPYKELLITFTFLVAGIIAAFALLALFMTGLVGLGWWVDFIGLIEVGNE